MESLDFNKILNRIKIEKSIIDELVNFEENKEDITIKRGFYIYGNPGSGKTHFIKKILKKMNYEIISYDSSDIRNKNVIRKITKFNTADVSVISSFKKDNRKIVILMDEIDGMNSGDKGGINSLIKLIRPKKTKKQKKEDVTVIPIICVGNYHVDKKIKELIKVCHNYELKTPTNEQVQHILNFLMPKIPNSDYILTFIQGDIRKIQLIHKIYQSTNNFDFMHHFIERKICNEDTKEITRKILTQPFCVNDHLNIMNETDRTSVGLLFHENVIDVLSKFPIDIPFYIKILENICFSDYIDRITFQKQVWIFNEMSSLIKTFYNNKLLHEKYKNIVCDGDIRFTKVLTKYSTEYNNMLFIDKLCQQLYMDKSDLFSFFMHLKKENEIEEIFDIFDNENYDITKLDVNRIYRFLDNFLGEG